MEFIASRVGCSSFSGALDSQETALMVKAQLKASRRAGGEWRGRTEIYLKPEDDTYRVAHWDLPIKQIEATCSTRERVG